MMSLAESVAAASADVKEAYAMAALSVAAS